MDDFVKLMMQQRVLDLRKEADNIELDLAQANERVRVLGKRQNMLHEEMMTCLTTLKQTYVSVKADVQLKMFGEIDSKLVAEAVASQELVYPKSSAEFPFARQSVGKNLYCVTWRYRGGDTRAVVVAAENESEAHKLAEIGQFDSDVRYHYLGVSRPDVAASVVLRSDSDD